MDVVILTERGAELFSALLRAEGEGWMNMAQLAEKTGKNQLSPHDRSLLKKMAKDGYIEEQEYKPRGFGRAGLQYRVL